MKLSLLMLPEPGLVTQRLFLGKKNPLLKNQAHDRPNPDRQIGECALPGVTGDGWVILLLGRLLMANLHPTPRNKNYSSLHH